MPKFILAAATLLLARPFRPDAKRAATPLAACGHPACTIGTFVLAPWG